MTSGRRKEHGGIPATALSPNCSCRPIHQGISGIIGCHYFVPMCLLPFLLVSHFCLLFFASHLVAL